MKFKFKSKLGLLDLAGFLAAVVLLIGFAAASPETSCNGTCGNQKLPFPFGFSAGCQIRLNCTPNGTVLAADFPVQSVSGDTILVNVPAMCGRPLESLRRLFTDNFAPTSHNAILLQNCKIAGDRCFIPTTLVETHFELLDCKPAGKGNISCYSEADNTTSSFINYQNLTTRGCRSLFSAISMESFVNSSSVSLDVQTVRIGWWLRGDCRCSKNAKCIPIAPPIEPNATAYRCQCSEGFAGDGFLAGVGCRKEPLCNPSNYLSGKCGGTTRVGVLAGGIAAGAALMITIGLIICFIRRRTKLRTRSRRTRNLYKTAGITIPVYPYKDIDKATDSFSEKRRLGNGAYGTVYSGKLSGSDEWVAVKRIKHRDAGGTDQVINEIKLLSSVSHPNLVRLLGCSIENEEQILVYEFMPNGTLLQHLQCEKGSGLTWPVRLTIACETAQAISYLHNAMHPPIYHRDIKSSNILLDHDYKSKVADFGLSRLGLVESSHISTAPQGTPGYLDPQYHQHFHLSDKSDVYSFGVVLIEIITALRVVDFNRPQNEVNLAALAVDRIGRGALSDIIDPFLKPYAMDAWTITSVHKIAELAFRCLAFHRDMRPSMMEVAVELEQVRLSKWQSSEMSIMRLSSSCASSSNSSEKPLNVKDKKHELDSSVGVFSSTASLDTVTNFSPASIENSWRSDQSSPSSSSLLSRVIR
ncbi:wall-associated receptor kinase-like 14 isoform X2 [Andrographis paniculata]|uniref:wall-associated receptor kinase-like 14 isoform X2 n=1 Tax=Andrographis paniculata TaxID=175694 RepID=UPI0021E9472F|nr:wall-associated receptor kinase-like 14 isoform X2 [Andrographis paniculata]